MLGVFYRVSQLWGNDLVQSLGNTCIRFKLNNKEYIFKIKISLLKKCFNYFDKYSSTFLL